MYKYNLYDSQLLAQKLCLILQGNISTSFAVYDFVDHSGKGVLDGENALLC